jgi:hypothetical protein
MCGFRCRALSPESRVDRHEFNTQSPKHVPTRGALSIQGWFRGMVLPLPATLSNGTGSAPSPRAVTSTPRTLCSISSVQAVQARIVMFTGSSNAR